MAMRAVTGYAKVVLKVAAYGAGFLAMWFVMTYGSAIVLDAISPDNQICDGIACASQGFQIVGLSVIAGFFLAAFTLYVVIRRLEFRAQPISQPSQTKMP